MKKFALSLVACLALVQSAYAATSPLAESLLEYEAITSAIGTDPNFDSIINPSEFIVDIQRITKQVNVLGNVEYKILTRLPPPPTALSHCESSSSSSSSHKHKHHHHHHHHHNLETRTYIVTLSVEPNPEIGPNIITVISITPLLQ